MNSYNLYDKEITDTTAKNISKDELELLEVYRRAKSMGYADVLITIQEGTRVKLWITEKMR